MNKLKEPCLKHKIAIPEFTTPEMIGMLLSNVCFERCEICGWYYDSKERLTKKETKDN